MLRCRSGKQGHGAGAQVCDCNAGVGSIPNQRTVIFNIFISELRHTSVLRSPEFGGKWGMECLHMRCRSSQVSFVYPARQKIHFLTK